MSQYRHSTLSSRGDSIRLLRLKPDTDKSADIHCEIFEYPLQTYSGFHLYEALSYVWGRSQKKLHIFIHSCSFDVTDNLYEALLELRNHTLERTIWVDAICIDQADQREKEHQIKIMAKIYGQAARVIVWLGEAATNSDQALDTIRIAGSEMSLRSPDNEVIKKSILALLQRQWFRRIWILQEVAAARNILIACGSAQIDGYAFCSGVEPLMEFCNAPPGLRSLIRSVTYLVRGAVFRPQRGTRASNAVCSLSELIDMYHTHEATLHSDKVYALLGISSDDFSNTGLAPDYSVPWKDLFETLIRHVLCKELSVEALPKDESATIRGGGYILGSISTEAKVTTNGRQDVFVAWRGTWDTAMTTEVWNSRWDLQPSAKQIRKEDVVCLFQGASKPTIIRFSEDHWIIIIIAATPPRTIQAKGEDVAWSRYLQNIDRLRIRELLCNWNWNKSPRKVPDQKEHNVARSSPNYIIETWNSALVFGDTEEHRKAERKFHQAMENYEMASREGFVIDFSTDLLWFTGSFDIDFMNKTYSQPPLLWAAKRGYKAVIGLLIGRLNANVDVQDKIGQTVLQAAAEGGHLAVVERLLLEKADVNAAPAGRGGRTALQAAAEGGHLAVVERLLLEKADVNAAPAEYNGRTALQAAAEGGHLAVVERLQLFEINQAALNMS